MQTQTQRLQVVIEKLQQGVTEVTKIFQPVLAETGGEPASTAELSTEREGLAPLAAELAELEDRIEAEVKRLRNLARRCEV